MVLLHWIQSFEYLCKMIKQRPVSWLTIKWWQYLESRYLDFDFITRGSAEKSYVAWATCCCWIWDIFGFGLWFSGQIMFLFPFLYILKGVIILLMDFWNKFLSTKKQQKGFESRIMQFFLSTVYSSLITSEKYSPLLETISTWAQSLDGATIIERFILN